MNTIEVKQKFVNRAIIEASKSNLKQRVGCVIFKCNSIIATGYNEIRHCRILPNRYKRWSNSLHAEQKAIIYSESSVKNASILVIRLSADDALTMAKPCVICQGLIYDMKIKHIYYSNKVGNIVKM